MSKPEGSDVWQKREHDVGQVFTPAIPVSADDLFAGRKTEIQTVIDSINQAGQHVIVYGERGVGKTSLANVLASYLILETGIKPISPRINCDATDTYDLLWRKVFERIARPVDQHAIGFGAETITVPESIASTLDDKKKVTPDMVFSILSGIGSETIIILDEFDRLQKNGVCQAVTDTIKMLSDYNVQATLIMLGVAETVTDLILEHRSIERALTQVAMPRMTPYELMEIIEKGTHKLGMTITEDAKGEIAKLSQGFPSYAHRLGLYSSRTAIRQRREEIDKLDIKQAIQETVQRTEQSLQNDYRRAVTSPQTKNLYEHVLLACALAESDQFGFFKAASVREPMSKIMGKKYEIPSFAKHLSDFCDQPRGSVLKKTGAKRKYSYRFTSPLMQPFVVMKAIVDERIPQD